MTRRTRRLTLTDIQERGRQPDARRRSAIAPRRGDQASLEIVVRGVLDGYQSVGGERPSVTAGESEAKIRPARGEDARAIHVLHTDCFDDLFAGLLGDYLPSTDERAERERSWTGPIGFPDDRHALFVAERHKRVIGFVAVGPTRDADEDAQTTGELRTVMVAADARDMGVGQALIAAGERVMRDHGLSTATLWVLPENSLAVRCYERCGWRPDGSKKPMQVGGHQIRAVRYRKQLAP